MTGFQCLKSKTQYKPILYGYSEVVLNYPLEQKAFISPKETRCHAYDMGEMGADRLRKWKCTAFLPSSAMAEKPS
jgi:hypothetical protein